MQQHVLFCFYFFLLFLCVFVEEVSEFLKSMGVQFKIPKDLYALPLLEYDESKEEKAVLNTNSNVKKTIFNLSNKNVFDIKPIIPCQKLKIRMENFSEDEKEFCEGEFDSEDEKLLKILWG